MAGMLGSRMGIEQAVMKGGNYASEEEGDSEGDEYDNREFEEDEVEEEEEDEREEEEEEESVSNNWAENEEHVEEDEEEVEEKGKKGKARYGRVKKMSKGVKAEGKDKKKKGKSSTARKSNTNRPSTTTTVTTFADLDRGPAVIFSPPQLARRSGGGRRKLVADMTTEELKVAREKNRELARRSRMRHKEERQAVLQRIDILGHTNDTLRHEASTLRTTLARLRAAALQEVAKGRHPGLARVIAGGTGAGGRSGKMGAVSGRNQAGSRH